MPICGLMDCGALVLRGMGRSTTSMINSLIGACVLRIVWIYTVFAMFREEWVLFINYPITWAVTAVVQFICIWRITRSLIRQADAASAVERPQTV
jgi:Na+-driven multidrug efflux pump